MAPLPQRTLVNFLALPLKGPSHGVQPVGAQIRTLVPSSGSKDECVHGEEPGLDSASWQVQGLGAKMTLPWWPVPASPRAQSMPWP